MHTVKLRPCKLPSPAVSVSVSNAVTDFEELEVLCSKGEHDSLYFDRNNLHELQHAFKSIHEACPVFLLKLVKRVVGSCLRKSLCYLTVSICLLITISIAIEETAISTLTRLDLG